MTIHVYTNVTGFSLLHVGSGTRIQNSRYNYYAHEHSTHTKLMTKSKLRILLVIELFQIPKQRSRTYNYMHYSMINSKLSILRAYRTKLNPSDLTKNLQCM